MTAARFCYVCYIASRHKYREFGMKVCMHINKQVLERRHRAHGGLRNTAQRNKIEVLKTIHHCIYRCVHIGEEGWAMKSQINRQEAHKERRAWGRMESALPHFLIHSQPKTLDSSDKVREKRCPICLLWRLRRGSILWWWRWSRWRLHYWWFACCWLRLVRWFWLLNHLYLRNAACWRRSTWWPWTMFRDKRRF